MGVELLEKLVNIFTEDQDQEFSEATASVLCLLSQVCADRMASQLGNRMVDRYGDQAVRIERDGCARCSSLYTPHSPGKGE